MVRLSKIIVGIVFISLITGCAQQPSWGIQAGAPGFWYGVLHGLIAPFALVASIFTDTRVYAVPNNGIWYDFGFMVGVAIWIASASRAAQSDGDSKVHFLGGQIDQLRASLEEKTDEADGLQKRLDESADEILRLKGSLQDKEEEIDSLNEQLDEKEE